MGRRNRRGLGPSWSCSSAGSCSRRSRTSWPATASATGPCGPRSRRRDAPTPAAGSPERRRPAGRIGVRRPRAPRVAMPLNQARRPDRHNIGLAPTGTSKPGELKREQFTGDVRRALQRRARAATTQAIQILIGAPGPPTRCCTAISRSGSSRPRIPALPIGGVGTIFDRNINTNTALGLDLPRRSRPSTAAGVRTTSDSVTIDVNISSGSYVEPTAQGAMKSITSPAASGPPA